MGLLISCFEKYATYAHDTGGSTIRKLIIVAFERTWSRAGCILAIVAPICGLSRSELMPMAMSHMEPRPV